MVPDFKPLIRAGAGILTKLEKLYEKNPKSLDKWKPDAATSSRISDNVHNVVLSDWLFLCRRAVEETFGKNSAQVKKFDAAGSAVDIDAKNYNPYRVAAEKLHYIVETLRVLEAERVAYASDKSKKKLETASRSRREKSSSIIYCTKCGAKNRGTDRVCRVCRAELEWKGMRMRVQGSDSKEVKDVAQGLFKASQAKPDKIQILFLAANPSDTQRVALIKEFKMIDKVLHKPGGRETFDLQHRPEVSVSELQDLFFRFHPQVIHFAGHGTRRGSLVFENEYGSREAAPPKALADLFGIINKRKQKVRCVVLNACYSEIQAAAINRHVPCVIGTTKVISDEAAIRFSIGFYRALDNGMSVKDAFRTGKNNIALHGIREDAAFKLICRKGIDPAKIFFADT